jgi:hypothetical protein
MKWHLVPIFQLTPSKSFVLVLEMVDMNTQEISGTCILKSKNINQSLISYLIWIILNKGVKVSRKWRRIKHKMSPTGISLEETLQYRMVLAKRHLRKIFCHMFITWSIQTSEISILSCLLSTKDHHSKQQ